MPESDLRDVSLVAVTSHEMRSPLAAIRGFVDMLQRRRDELTEDEIDEFLQVIAAQTDRLIRLADDLVTMESLDDASLAVHPEPIVLVPALEQLVREIRAANASSCASPPRRRRRSRPTRCGSGRCSRTCSPSPEVLEEASMVAVEVDPVAGDEIGIAVIDHGIGIEALERERVRAVLPHGRRLVPRRVQASDSRSRDGSSMPSTAEIAAEPTPGGVPRSGSRFRCVRRALSTRSTVRSKVMGLNGFVKYSSAPIAIARSRPSSPSAVTMITRAPPR